MTVTLPLRDPDAGFIVREAVLLVKLAEAVSDPPSFPVAITVFDPADPEGTVKVQLNPPVPDVV